jgi:sugar phosphate isomerase/epimerase
MAQFRVGIDSYCLNPLRLDPFTLLDWVARAGGEGVQFSEVHLPPNRDADEGFLAELAQDVRRRGMYLEWGGGQHVPLDTTTWKPKDLAEINRRAAEQACALGTQVIRSCSGGFFRWHDEAPSTEELLRAMAKALRPQAPVFEDRGVTLAIELHFEFTTFELIRLFEMCEAEPGGWLGICLDTFNVLPMLEDPVLGTERVLPWVVSTHIKDGAIDLYDGGLVTYPTAVGEGVVDFPAILGRLADLERPINLSVEDHGGIFKTPFFDERFRSRFPDLEVGELTRLISTAQEYRERIRAGEVAPTARADWPDLCEDRTHHGLTSLRRIVDAMGMRAS